MCAVQILPPTRTIFFPRRVNASRIGSKDREAKTIAGADLKDAKAVLDELGN